MIDQAALHLSKAELEAGLPAVTLSPQDAGTIEMIVVRPTEDERLTPDTVEISAALGVHGDHWSKGKYRVHRDTQVAIINARLLDLVSGGRDRWSLAGDNIVADLDLSQFNLVPGQKLEMGSAVVEITDTPHEGCKKFAGRFGAQALRFVNVGVGKEMRLRGIYARVVQDGAISVGDRISKL
jgi:MOSC domain-containing protein YiiM